MLAVVCDTNVLREQLTGASGPWQALLERSRLSTLKLVVPELVWLELEQLTRERVAEAYVKWRRGTDDLRRLGAGPPEWPANDEDRHRAALDAVGAVRGAFTASGGVTPGLPDVPHLAVVRRALARQRPFDAAGKDGYRDALLWETVLALARGGQRVILVSADARAFASGKGESLKLHPDLAHEAGVTTDGAGTVELAGSLGHAAELVDADAAEARALVDRLLAGKELVADIMRSLIEQAEGEMLSGELLSRLGWSSFVVGAAVDAIDDLHGVEVVSASRIDGQRTAAEVALGLTALLDLRFEDTDDAVRALSNDPSLELEGLGMLDGLLQGHVERPLIVHAGVVLDSENEQLISARLLRLASPWATNDQPSQLRLGFS